MLKGFDQTTNIILQDCHERVFSPTAGVEQVPLGLYIIRGDNMCVWLWWPRLFVCILWH